MTTTACQGKLNLNKQCKNEIIPEHNFCQRHLYLEEYTQDMMEKLIRCSRCTNMIYEFGTLKRCPVCTDDAKKSNAEASSKKIKCSAIDRNMETCRNKVSQLGEFCSLHSYMKTYTKDMLENLSICSTCRKCFYSANFKTCEMCRNKKKYKLIFIIVIKWIFNFCYFKNFKI